MYEGRPYDIFKECVCLHEQFVSLARKSDDHIDSEENLWATCNFATGPYIFYLLGEGSRVVTPSHCLKNSIAARLERNVIMGEELAA